MYGTFEMDTEGGRARICWVDVSSIYYSGTSVRVSLRNGVQYLTYFWGEAEQAQARAEEAYRALSNAWDEYRHQKGAT